jgi:DNA-directed RNA polymerase subunit RPC12/RpoP
MSGHVHSLDRLYPRSVYRCSECGLVHGTRAVNGAVNWQCTNQLFPKVGAAKHGADAKQDYLGQRCTTCGELVTADEARALIQAEDAEHAARWNR